MTNLRIFYLSQTLSYMYFWVAIAIPYLMYRGLSSAEAFSLLAIYQLVGVFLEYPTGVIGDRFGYRKVTYLGNTLNFASMILMAVSDNYYWYLFCLLLLALGSGFLSGNDMGILKSVSSNIKKDTANYNSLSDFVLFVAAILGGIIGKISFEAALIVSGTCMLLANVPIYFLGKAIPQVKNTSSLFQIVRQGFGELIKPGFKQLFIAVAIFGGLSFTVKSVIGSFANIFQTDLVSIGIVIGLVGLVRSIGGKLYAEFPRKNIVGITLLVILSTILMGVSPNFYTVTGLILFSQLFIGYILSKIDGDIHDFASDHVRASLFSLKRLTMRIVASGYLSLYGFALGFIHISTIMYGTSIIFLIATVLSWRYLTSRLVSTSTSDVEQGK